ncbi:MAG: hypothetical protein KJN93_00560 [Alphaproteobacteria bacterium]|nr:hypothetical protein [Alphaproteobacteria bacterium]
MRFLLRWIGRALLLLVLLVVVLLAPVGYVELACQGPETEDTYQPIITDAAWQRAESRTLMTYPEWHIVHAYDDYAKVIAAADPHDFGYLRAIAGFWATLCPLTEKSASMGGVTTDSKMTIYTIGVSFTAELLAKAAYEETLGRIATWVRGAERAPLDDLSARQAADYAAFLRQVPWYKWDFARDKAELAAAATDALRDRERAFALGLEYSVKAAYAQVIAGAVADIGADELRLRSVVTGLTPEHLAADPEITVIETLAQGTVIETDRYRAYTRILERLAAAGADLVEIAGNDQILFTATSDQGTADDALYSFARQGYGDFRHLIVLPVSDLADRLRDLGGLRLEHVHDY